MDSDTMFEARLVRAWRDYTDHVVLPFDPDEVTEQAIGLRRGPMRFRVLLVPLVALALLLALAIGVVTLSTLDEPAPSPAVDAFNGGTLRSAAGSGHSATLLPDGRVLVISGTWRGGAYGATVNSAEVWDPVEGSSTPTGRLVTGRPTATATLLSDGRVLVVGGFRGLAYPSTAIAAAEVWDAASDSFREAGAVWLEPRVGHTATLLQDGRVLVIGGSGPAGQLASAEVWDPTTETFRSAGSLATTRSGPHGHAVGRWPRPRPRRLDVERRRPHHVLRHGCGAVGSGHRVFHPCRRAGRGPCRTHRDAALRRWGAGRRRLHRVGVWERFR